MSSNKMQWTKPQLIVLTRGTPEESVLTHCKRIGFAGEVTAQAFGQEGCDRAAAKDCGVCQSRSGS